MSTHHDEHTAKELLAKSLLHEESPARRDAHMKMWTAVAVCSLVVVVAYGLVVVRSYDFLDAKRSIAAAASGMKDLGAKLAPVADQPKILWDGLKQNLAQQAQTQVESSVVQEMKKNIEAKNSAEVAAPAPTSTQAPAFPVAQESKTKPSGKK